MPCGSNSPHTQQGDREAPFSLDPSCIFKTGTNKEHLQTPQKMGSEITGDNDAAKVVISERACVCRELKLDQCVCMQQLCPVGFDRVQLVRASMPAPTRLTLYLGDPSGASPRPPEICDADDSNNGGGGTVPRDNTAGSRAPPATWHLGSNRN